MKKKTIPALTLTGGRLSDFGGQKAVKEYRVWIHPYDGDDFYYTFKSLISAKLFAEHERRKGIHTKVENPLAVVWDKKHKDYREVIVNKLKKAKEISYFNKIVNKLPK